MERPAIVSDEHLEYLDELRRSGKVNMFGAAALLHQDFFPDISKAESYEILGYWHKTFTERHPEMAR